MGLASGSLAGDWLVVGANQDDNQGQDSASAYVFPASVAKDTCVPIDLGCPACDAADTNRDLLVDALDVEFILARFDSASGGCDTTTATPVFTCRP
ncbi:MAG: hypothetical protein IH988_03010, partial [Planctomycetes bacterium]|nr:hypothetical protein [Planctomycetota bacterium]